MDTVGVVMKHLGTASAGFLLFSIPFGAYYHEAKSEREDLAHGFPLAAGLTDEQRDTYRMVEKALERRGLTMDHVIAAKEDATELDIQGQTRPWYTALFKCATNAVFNQRIFVMSAEKIANFSAAQRQEYVNQLVDVYFEHYQARAEKYTARVQRTSNDLAVVSAVLDALDNNYDQTMAQLREGIFHDLVTGHDHYFRLYQGEQSAQTNPASKSRFTDVDILDCISDRDVRRGQVYSELQGIETEKTQEMHRLVKEFSGLSSALTQDALQRMGVVSWKDAVQQHQRNEIVR